MDPKVQIVKFKKWVMSPDRVIMTVHWKDAEGNFHVNMSEDTNEGNRIRFRKLINEGVWSPGAIPIAGDDDEDLPF